MSNRVQFAVVVFAAMLSACLFLGTVLADPIVRSTDGAGAIPPAAAIPATQPRARAYLFRGALGPIFSRGMDGLTQRLQQAASGLTSTNSRFAGLSPTRPSAITVKIPFRLP